jgi:hypothetical protein
MTHEQISRRAAMETFFIKLVVATAPLILLVVSVTMLTCISHRRTHHSMSWHRRRRTILKTMAAGILLR